MIILRQNNFSEEGSEKNRAAKEVGMATGALGVGALGGLGVHSLAKNSSNLVNKAHRSLTTRVRERAGNIADKTGKVGLEWAAEYKKHANPKIEKLRNIRGKIRPVTDKVAKFANTRGGKWALIGGTTAALGGAAYLGAKKRDKEK